MSTKKSPTKTDLIADLQRVHQKFGKVSRDSYEQHGKFTRTNFEMFWSTFTQFAVEAGIGASKNAIKTHESEMSEISGNLWTVSMPKTRIHTLEELVEHFQVDLSIWEVERFRCNKWEFGGFEKAVGSSGDWSRGSKDPIVTPLFQVRADFKKKKDVIAVRKEIAAILAEAKLDAPLPKGMKRPTVTSGKMLEVNIPDVHFGKLAWAKETGYENYDTRIAEVIHDRAVDAIIARSAKYDYEKIVYVVGNDLLQADDNESQTTSGTVVTTDARYKKTFQVARRSVIRAIEKLRALAPVEVVIVPGNHDELSIWHLGESLDIYFAKYGDVKVQNQPDPRKYVEFGKVMLMFVHGHKGKRNDYPLQMAAERSEMFGRTKWREVHCGHTHQTKLDEQHGIRVRVLPALCPPDDWHAENGYTGNLRCAEAFVWDSEEGLLDIIYYNDGAQPAVNTVYTTKVG
jgi:hypothetical protein